MPDAPILEVQDLVVEFAGDAGKVRALDRVSFSLQKNKTLGIVGESGCGKSVTSLAIMGLLPKPAGKVVDGRIHYHGENLLALNSQQMSRIRGRKIAMIFQEPMTALNPVHRIGRQIGEVLRIHFPQMGADEVEKSCVELLEKVGIPDPGKRMREYVHQLSGGMRQRVMIAMALACKPDILIADEPTTALDVTIQAQILELLKNLQSEMGMSVIFITHDLGVIARVCDDVVVMYAGTKTHLSWIMAWISLPSAMTSCSSTDLRALSISASSAGSAVLVTLLVCGLLAFSEW